MNRFFPDNRPENTFIGETSNTSSNSTKFFTEQGPKFGYGIELEAYIVAFATGCVPRSGSIVVIYFVIVPQLW